MTLAFVLLAIGLILIFLEFFLPGGIIGAAGSILLLLSIAFFSMNSDSLTAIILYIIAVVVVVIVLIKFALWRIKKSGPKKSIFLQSDQEGFIASGFEKEYIGKQAVAFTDLKPAGHIVVEKKRVQAVSKAGYIIKGTEVMVIGGDGAHLIVIPK